MPRRRRDEPGERALVRARLASLQPREGWVPRVPDPLPGDGVPSEPRPSGGVGPEPPSGDGAPSGPVPVDAGRSDPGPRVGGRADPWPDESWPAADAWFGPLPGGTGASAAAERPPPGPTERSWAAEWPAEPVPADSDPLRAPRRGRHRAERLGDRVPLVLRSAVAQGLPEPVREGRTALGTGQAVVVLVVALLAVVGAAVVVWVSRPQVEPAPVVSPVVEAAGTPLPGAVAGTTSPGPGPSGGVTADTGAGLPPAGEVVVHVAGLVARAGLVRLPAGSRVADAIEAAGGARAGVDLTPLNLARPLADGEQVLVGVEPPPGAEVQGGVVAAPGGSASPATGDPRVDLNTATVTQLEELPGVGPVLAGRIVAWREQHGRFTSTEELREVSGIGPRTFEALADLVRV